MGVVNVTPDSFSDGGRYFSPEAAVQHALALAEEGADILDIGAESTRPGAEPVPEEEELRRLLPVVDPLVRDASVVLSIDTYKPRVAEACLALGAHLINDVTGLRNLEMIRVVADYGAAVCVMHMRGSPKTMQENPQYTDVVAEVKAYLKTQAAIAVDEGIEPTSILLDPGIGFGKTLEHNLELLRRLREIREMGYPVLVGTSRKRFLGTLLGGAPVSERLPGTLASVAVAIAHGANAVRVHDVREVIPVVRVADAICHGVKVSHET